MGKPPVYLKIGQEAPAKGSIIPQDGHFGASCYSKKDGIRAALTHSRGTLWQLVDLV